MSELIDTYLVEFCIGFVIFCAAIAVYAIRDSVKHSHEDEEMESIRRHNENNRKSGS